MSAHIPKNIKIVTAILTAWRRIPSLFLKTKIPSSNPGNNARCEDVLVANVSDLGSRNSDSVERFAESGSGHFLVNLLKEI
jgi:hypothetical protein